MNTDKKDLLTDILGWGNAARPNPTIEGLCNQIGCHYEEFSEMAYALGDNDLSKNAEVAGNYYKCARFLSLALSNKGDLKDLIDSLADQIVTATVTLGLLEKLDCITSARDVIAEVNRANWSKTEHGKFVFDENGKIRKGKDYLPPNLNQFIK